MSAEKDETAKVSEESREPRRIILRVSGVKVMLRKAEIKRGPRGRFVRRFKEILGRIHGAPDEPFCGVESYEPPRRPIVPRPVAGHDLLGKEDLGERENGRSRGEDDDCDDD
jgi:hypothetical protein